jgi:uncharacterized protein
MADSMAEFRINISNLSEGIHEYIFEAEPAKIGLDERFSGILKMTVKLDKSPRQILLQAEMQVQGVFDCDRCLEQFHKQVGGKYSLVYIQGDRSTVDVKKEEEIQVLSADTNYIDLDEDVRQYIYLTVPAKLLCKEDCKGLCSVCGVNKNYKHCKCENQIVDARWDPLKKLSHN